MPGRNILAVDVGGSHVKLLVSVGGSERRSFVSGPALTAPELVKRVAAQTADWSYDAVTVGVPAPVHGGHVVSSR
jgi:polyphosphate glucokinase